MPQSIEQRRKNFNILVFWFNCFFLPIKNSMHTFIFAHIHSHTYKRRKRLKKSLHSSYHLFLLDSIYEFLPSKYSIFLSSSTHESVNTLRQSNWCVLSLMILYHVTALGSISNSRSFYTSKCNLMLLHVTYHINPLNAITLYLRYTNIWTVKLFSWSWNTWLFFIRSSFKIVLFKKMTSELCSEA